jgi:hypothetical protein
VTERVTEPVSERPRLRIVRGDPSEEEVAALTAVLGAVAGAAASSSEEPAAAPRSAWADPAHRLRAPLHPGPGAWRTSGLPR